MMALTWVGGLVRRRPGRLLAATLGVALAVALLASIGSFLSTSKATMTRRAIADVAVDWQVEAQPGADLASFADTVRSDPNVTTARQVDIATTTGLEATVGGSTQTTGPGVVLGLPADYRATFPDAIRDLAGAPNGVLLAQQTAANLRAAPGDSITIGRAGMGPVAVTVDGIVDLPQADSLFQKVGAAPQSQPKAPPDNVVLVPTQVFHELFDGLASARPDQVITQLHATVDHQLASDPSAAYDQVGGRARNLEVQLAGAGLVGDNLGATLDAARSDALYAQILFLFLGLPGAVLAGLLTITIAGVGRDRRRGEQALLRARGATTRQLVQVGTTEALAVGLSGALLGVGLASVVGRVAFGSSSFGATTLSAIGWVAAAALAGLLIAVAAVAVPAWHDARDESVAVGRMSVGRFTAPRWMRAKLDVLLLVGGGLVFWLSSRNGYKLVLAPEGVPTISVSYWAFAGPAMVWIGLGLFTWRLADGLLHRGRGVVAAAARPLSGPLAGTVAASMSRQRRMLARALVLVALTVSFAASTAVFNATYQQQAEVDALLTNGADVTVTESPGVEVGPDASAALQAVPGVSSVEPVQHRFAYVGADLQDLYGVRTDTIVDATKLQDTYFEGGTARDLIGRLASAPDSVLVSLETVKDFQLLPGDPITLRLQDGKTKAFTDVAFHYVGVAKEFPTAPSDSFLVANADYIASVTGSAAVGTFLVSTDGASPATVADRVRTELGTTASVTDISSSRRIIGSSLTSVDLGGLTRVELGFALLLTAAATGLVLVLGLAERRRTFAIASALGATTRQLGSFIWSESTLVSVGGLIAGAASGWLLTHMLIKVLTGVFDPAPSSLAVPWAYLGAVLGVAAAAVIVASASAVRAGEHASITDLRDL